MVASFLKHSVYNGNLSNSEKLGVKDEFNVNIFPIKSITLCLIHFIRLGEYITEGTIIFVIW